ncbi:aminotransferase class I/II-fold pyridoxal phosphate-dependent enzyme, partial [Clostridium perfringens]
SMDGDVAPLDDLARIASRHDAMLLIDEAHASGVFGPRGRGLAHHLHHRDDVVTLHTCGKALGVEGGLLCLPAHLREFLINRGRGFVFSTA